MAVPEASSPAAKSAVAEVPAAAPSPLASDVPNAAATVSSTVPSAVVDAIPVPSTDVEDKALPKASSSAKSAVATASAAAPSPLASTSPKALAIGPSSPVAVVSALALPVPSTDVEEVVLPELASPSKAASAEVAAAAPSPIVMESPNARANWSSTEQSAVLLASPVPSTDVEDMALPEASSPAKSAVAEVPAAAPSPLASDVPNAAATVSSTDPWAWVWASPVPSTDVEDMALPEASSSAKSAAADPSAAAPSPLAVESPLALAIGPSSPVAV